MHPFLLGFFCDACWDLCAVGLDCDLRLEWEDSKLLHLGKGVTDFLRHILCPNFHRFFCGQIDYCTKRNSSHEN